MQQNMGFSEERERSQEDAYSFFLLYRSAKGCTDKMLFQENDVPPTIKGSKPEDVIAPDVKNALQAPAFPAANDITVPSPPPLKLQVADHISMTNLQKDLQNLFEYNMMLREKLIAAQSMLHSLANKGSTLAPDSGDIIIRE
ncbi:hypothetical protein BC332_30416 [Capsicum chinense]|nr:hypothetical protein BC332_30416 [Capsicum chinense]